MTYYGSRGGLYDGQSRREIADEWVRARYRQEAQVAAGELQWDTFERVLEIIGDEVGRRRLSQAKVTVTDDVDSTFSATISNAQRHLTERRTKPFQVRTAVTTDDATNVVVTFDAKAGGRLIVIAEGTVRRSVYGVIGMLKSEAERGRIPGTTIKDFVEYDASSTPAGGTRKRVVKWGAVFVVGVAVGVAYLTGQTVLSSVNSILFALGAGALVAAITDWSDGPSN
jgi:hypothetical protein